MIIGHGIVPWYMLDALHSSLHRRTVVYIRIAVHRSTLLKPPLYHQIRCFLQNQPHTILTKQSAFGFLLSHHFPAIVRDHEALQQARTAGIEAVIQTYLPQTKGARRKGDIAKAARSGTKGA